MTCLLSGLIGKKCKVVFFFIVCTRHVACKLFIFFLLFTSSSWSRLSIPFHFIFYLLEMMSKNVKCASLALMSVGLIGLCAKKRQLMQTYYPWIDCTDQYIKEQRSNIKASIGDDPPHYEKRQKEVEAYQQLMENVVIPILQHKRVYKRRQHSFQFDTKEHVCARIPLSQIRHKVKNFQHLFVCKNHALLFDKGPTAFPSLYEGAIDKYCPFQVRLASFMGIKYVTVRVVHK